jgi:hypothetical protein
MFQIISDSENENEGEANNKTQGRRYPKPERKRMEFPDIILYQAVQTGDDELSEPADFNEAMKAVDTNKWQHAMEEQLQFLKINKAWNLVEPPNDKQIVTSEFIKSRGMLLEMCGSLPWDPPTGYQIVTTPSADFNYSRQAIANNSRPVTSRAPPQASHNKSYVFTELVNKSAHHLQPSINCGNLPQIGDHDVICQKMLLLELR